MASYKRLNKSVLADTLQWRSWISERFSAHCALSAFICHFDIFSFAYWGVLVPLNISELCHHHTRHFTSDWHLYLHLFLHLHMSMKKISLKKICNKSLMNFNFCLTNKNIYTQKDFAKRSITQMYLENYANKCCILITTYYNGIKYILLAL